MKITVIAATIFEIQPSINVFSNNPVQFIVTGIGMLSTAVSLTKIVLDEKPDIVIQAGIAGCFNTEMPLGSVVVVNSETIGDLGVNENGDWQDVFDLKLVEGSSVPFTNKQITNPYIKQLNTLSLDEVAAISINEVSTNQQRIKQLQAKYNPIIESMEGAALHYVCTDLKVPFLQLRSISNYIGERDKSKWQMKEAIANLNETLIILLQQLLI